MFPNFSFLCFSDAKLKAYLDTHRHVLFEYFRCHQSVLCGYVHEKVPIEVLKSWLAAMKGEYQRQTVKLMSRGLGDSGQWSRLFIRQYFLFMIFNVISNVTAFVFFKSFFMIQTYLGTILIVHARSYFVWLTGWPWGAHTCLYVVWPDFESRPSDKLSSLCFVGGVIHQCVCPPSDGH